MIWKIRTICKDEIMSVKGVGREALGRIVVLTVHAYAEFTDGQPNAG